MADTRSLFTLAALPVVSDCSNFAMEQNRRRHECRNAANSTVGPFSDFFEDGWLIGELVVQTPDDEVHRHIELISVSSYVLTLKCCSTGVEDSDWWALLLLLKEEYHTLSCYANQQ